MKFERMTVSALMDLVVWESYAGGSHQESLPGYMSTKTIDGVPVRDLFEWCFWAPVPNVMHTEDKLLATPTLWNTHATSNRYERPGFVYVLRKDKPMSTGARLALGVTAASVVLGIGALLWDAGRTKPPAPPPPQPHPL